MAAADPKEQFYRHFQASVAAIQDQINCLATVPPSGDEHKHATETVLASISRLSHEVMDASEYIPAYDQRAYGQAAKALTDKLNEATGKLGSKPRFQFKPRTQKTALSRSQDSRQDEPSEPAQNRREDPVVVTDDGVRDAGASPSDKSKDYNEEMARPLPSGSAVRRPSFSKAEAIAICGQTGLHIILPSTATPASCPGSLTNLERCVVEADRPTEASSVAFAGLTLKDISHSLVAAGHVAGAVHLTGAVGSVVVVAARQVRMHECRNVDVYLRCTSHPIIEDCSGMRFAPLPQCYMAQTHGEGSDQWDQVDDFKWLKNEPSPNWSVLPEEQRIPEDVWRTMLSGQPSPSSEDTLRRVGIPRT